jgi:hypothetical protein
MATNLFKLLSDKFGRESVVAASAVHVVPVEELQTKTLFSQVKIWLISNNGLEI